MTREEFINKWYAYGGSREVMESDLDLVERESFNRGYAAGIFHDVDNPNAHSQRNRAYKVWQDTLNKQP